jgi:hypothetical protein
MASPLIQKQSASFAKLQVKELVVFLSFILRIAKTSALRDTIVALEAQFA